MNDVDKYIFNFDIEIQDRLNTIRQVFIDTLPNAQECIRYNMPSFKVGKYHLYYAAFKKHIGFYPISGLPEMENEIAFYRAKGTKYSLHFMHNKPLPLELIEKIIKLKLLK